MTCQQQHIKTEKDKLKDLLKKYKPMINVHQERLKAKKIEFDIQQFEKRCLEEEKEEQYAKLVQTLKRNPNKKSPSKLFQMFYRQESEKQVVNEGEAVEEKHEEGELKVHTISESVKEIPQHLKDIIIQSQLYNGMEQPPWEVQSR